MRQKMSIIVRPDWYLKIVLSQGEKVSIVGWGNLIWSSSLEKNPLKENTKYKIVYCSGRLVPPAGSCSSTSLTFLWPSRTVSAAPSWRSSTSRSRLKWTSTRGLWRITVTTPSSWRIPLKNSGNSWNKDRNRDRLGKTKILIISGKLLFFSKIFLSY